MQDLSQRYERAKSSIKVVAGDPAALSSMKEADPAGFNLMLAVAFDVEARRTIDVFPQEQTSADAWFVCTPVESNLPDLTIPEASSHDEAIATAVEAFDLELRFASQFAAKTV